MPRGLTTDQKTQLAAAIRFPAYFVHLDLAAPTADVRVWSGKGNITALSQTWTGLGEMGVIEGLEHGRSLRANSISLSLIGIPGDAISAGIIASTRAVRYQMRPLAVYLGFLHVDTGALLHDPTVIWAGYADVLTMRLGATISANLTGEHLSSHLRRTNGARASTENHNQRVGGSPRDLFFEPQNRLMGQPQPQLGG